MLEKIQRTLEEFGLPVFYGLVPDGEELESWDYYVFNRAEMEKAGNVNYKQYYQVHVICENYVPEDEVMKIIQKIGEIPGMNVADKPITYDYTTKGSTDLVVEMATITFARPVRGCL